MANFDVRRILVDQGSLCEVMYIGLFKTLQLTKKNLVPCVGADLQGFNGSMTKLWGYVDLIVTFGEAKSTKSIKVKFFVVDCPSLYNCIIERPTLSKMFAVSSTVHLKIKYYTQDGQVATLHGDIVAARRCLEATAMNKNSIVTPKKDKGSQKQISAVKTIELENGVDLDSRFSKKELKEHKKEKKELLRKEILRPIPSGEFGIVTFGEEPSKGVKIGANLSDLVKRQLSTCLKEDSLFVVLQKCSESTLRSHVIN
ncbi:hypothetical protein A2U01_0009975 [Trifolium medium]|uniref:Uncharacterized protein n=1 Tax=Trifolium medium TaxID=97028 RepID=A0A392MNG5_9FABA|nr:hypothetical protein [Trifolium medium]